MCRRSRHSLTFVEQLQELARLRDQGLLTTWEFTVKKTELLDRI